MRRRRAFARRTRVVRRGSRPPVRRWSRSSKVTRSSWISTCWSRAPSSPTVVAKLPGLRCASPQPYAAQHPGPGVDRRDQRRPRSCGSGRDRPAACMGGRRPRRLKRWWVRIVRNLGSRTAAFERRVAGVCAGWVVTGRLLSVDEAEGRRPYRLTGLRHRPVVGEPVERLVIVVPPAHEPAVGTRCRALGKGLTVLAVAPDGVAGATGEAASDITEIEQLP